MPSTLLRPKGAVTIPKQSSKGTRWSGNIALEGTQKAGGEADNRLPQCPSLVNDSLSLEVYWDQLKVRQA